MSRPLDSGAYRNVCSAAPSDLMVATKDFSGLTSSPCALASAAASCAIDSLDRCMGITVTVMKQGKTDGARFRALRPDAMAKGLLRILRHEALELGLRSFVVLMRFVRPRKGRRKLRPSIRVSVAVTSAQVRWRGQLSTGPSET